MLSTRVASESDHNILTQNAAIHSLRAVNRERTEKREIQFH